MCAMMGAAVALCVGLLNWIGPAHRLCLEHVAKVLALVASMLLIGQTFAALYRRLVGPATNRSIIRFSSASRRNSGGGGTGRFGTFLMSMCFAPPGGRGGPSFATLIVFALSGLIHEYVFGVATGQVQGWQMLFFMVQGCAAAATLASADGFDARLYSGRGHWRLTWRRR